MSWTDMTQLTSCYAWFKPESLASSYANGDPISSWADSSGNGRDVSQATSANQPLAVANAINGYMAADFDGSNDFLSSASYTQSGDVAVTTVLNIDSFPSLSTSVNIQNSATPASPQFVDTWVQNLFRSTGNFNCYQRASSSTRFIGNLAFTPDYLSTGTSYITTFSLNSLVSDLRVNGRSLNNGANWSNLSTISPPSGTAYIHLGDGYGNLNAKMTEVIIYDSASLDNAEAMWVEGYLADKYAITLAAGHLFKNEPPANPPTMYNPSSSGGGSSSPTYTSTAGTQIYPFRTLAEDDFDKGRTKFHPLS